MAKRFIDTSFYKSPFVRGLKGSLKALYSFIICDCDGAGIWFKDLPIASMYIGFEITEKDFNVFIEKNKCIDLKNGKYFFPDFLQHQYPKGLSVHNPAQKNFILELQRNLIIDSDLKPLWSTFEGTKVMVMEKVEVKEDEKAKVIPIENLVFPFESETFKNVWNVLVKEKKWKNKSFAALQASLDKLSKHTESDAIQMMKDSIAGGWQGLFEIKTQKNGQNTASDERIKRQNEREQLRNILDQSFGTG